MTRLYGDEQREVVKQIIEELIERIESNYLQTFEHLNEFGLGEGMIVRITQLLLLSRDGACTPLNNELKEINQRNKLL